MKTQDIVRIVLVYFLIIMCLIGFAYVLHAINGYNRVLCSFIAISACILIIVFVEDIVKFFDELHSNKRKLRKKKELKNFS